MKFNSDPCPHIKSCPHKVQCAMEDWEYVDASGIFDIADYAATFEGKRRSEFLIAACYEFNSRGARQKFRVHAER